MSDLDLKEQLNIEEISERFYGFTESLISVKFPQFGNVHIVSPEAIPDKGMNVHLIDPAEGRNWFQHWYRIIGRGPERVVWLYREWPGHYHVPGVGIPGDWAVPDGKKPDGRRGPAQKTFGWGFRRYKQEIARLEGWKDYKLYGPDGEEPGKVQIEQWDDRRGSDESIKFRFIDSRAATSPRVENDMPVTLQSELDDIGLFCDLTPRDLQWEGVEAIQEVLDYDRESPMSYFNKPHFYINKECINTIFSLATWTGEDGQKGACKDPIDLIRYLLQLGLDEIRKADMQGRGGGSW